MATFEVSARMTVRPGQLQRFNNHFMAVSPEQQRLLLSVSCDDVTNGRMPGPYALLRPETRLSARDVDTICAAAHQAEARPAAGL